MIYLDNAATSWPKPGSVYQTMDEFLRTKGGNPGRGSHRMALAARQTVEGVRVLLARFINSPEIERVIFTLNCTEALNLGLKGLLSAGDHVITDCIGHNSLVRPLRGLESRGITVTRVPPSPAKGIVSISDIEAAITSNTKLLVVTHASNVNGVIQPIEAYGAFARGHNMIFMVDAAQTGGKFPIDVQSANIDLLALSGHKGLFGPPGTGILFIGERVELKPLHEGGTGSYSEQEEQPTTLPDRYESGTVNSVGISGLGAGVRYIIQEGIEKIRSHEQQLTEYLIKGLAKIPKITSYVAKTISLQAPVVSLNIEGYEPGEIGSILDQVFDIKVRTGLHCAPAAHKTFGTYPLGTVRLSLGYFNTKEEIDLTLDALEKITKAGRLSAKSVRVT